MMWISLLLLFLVLMVGYIEISWIIFRKQSKFHHVPLDLELINLGSTYAYYGLEYSEKKIKAFNMALIPQYLYYDNEMLHKYSKNLKSGAFVLMVLPNFVFCVDGEKVGYQNDEYYLFLKPWEIAEFQMKKYIKIRWKAIWEPIFHEKKKRNQKWTGYVATTEEKKGHASRRIADWEKNIGIRNTENFEITKELQDRIEKNILLVVEMIAFCEEIDLNPVLVLMPTSDIMQDLLQKNLLNKCLFTPVRKILEETKVTILDYSEDMEFSDEGLYLNSDCLNEQGRILFTEKVLRDLKIG